jgi:hypothetical protein
MKCLGDDAILGYEIVVAHIQVRRAAAIWIVNLAP